MSKINKLPKRKPETNKGDYGRVLIIAGSPGMTGAAVLASRGCLRVGAGLTYLAVPKGLVNFVDSMTPEVITLPFEKINNVKPDVAAIGPGLTVSKASRTLLRSTINALCSTFIIDADGLNNIADEPEIMRKIKNLIITPHPGEMSRLIKKSVDHIQKNRAAVARETAKRFGCVVVLKGHKTVVADPAGKVFINSTGNPGMASGGVGDVLTGMIAGLAGQGLSSFEAASAGVYLHGLAGDLAAREKGEYGLIASDLVEKIPYAIQKIY
ncbi:NAD(P)H-hydrate dehydratase [candidate division WOR-1 bacterium RIFCSPHIGHO2_01_FULL_53_15]|uniref:ADP-dependent (S)-NAD(P)H-hydrate dehydratase n=1 Tax=candidate division WOR-1 bacterium RIFCSPHIGHO2_01_FULL_53_15 TaxID=1802564 RepID=A0A1F4PZL5_UNCSA|nr:MAG: NAD(P)H-hydrate dehydratase [candidate division WOR-1 bacterium RIFCSPHIGHO2_01_FULL_53_15]OGC10790.1 MAG: NAD(P)H-hydrate dehydratase [candidate division WOR-1 bacterium RIFCSPHIGHO2_02_FULL_53_26]